uniref:(northern house mosquito) hypothetical protein n=1 Tax=Culex pipiens TaxID=7175 RepID=A0A8D8LD17_CULPI
MTDDGRPRACFDGNDSITVPPLCCRLYTSCLAVSWATANKHRCVCVVGMKIKAMSAELFFSILHSTKKCRIFTFDEWNYARIRQRNSYPYTALTVSLVN